MSHATADLKTAIDRAAINKDPIIRNANVSDDGKYRYMLDRLWRAEAGPMIFCMLNPSTADHLVDDPTIRRCMHFANREGRGGLIVINLFAARATDPRELLTMADPVGPENEKTWGAVLRLAHKDALPVVAAWGANKKARDQSAKFQRLARQYDVSLWSLNSLTQEGFPRHPLYLPNDAGLRRFV